MRINCPHCGSREASEFAYHGDATVTRPDPAGPAAAERFYVAVYLRDNPAGPHDEHWYHAGGCKSWLRVRRDTRTHDVLAVDFARGQLSVEQRRVA